MIRPSEHPHPYTPAQYSDVWDLWRELYHVFGVGIGRTPYYGYRHLDNDDLSRAIMSNGGMYGDRSDEITLSVCAYGRSIADTSVSGNTDTARANLEYLEETYPEFLQSAGDTLTTSLEIVVGYLPENEPTDEALEEFRKLVREISSLEVEPILCDETLSRVQREIAEEAWSNGDEESVKRAIVRMLEERGEEIPEDLTIHGGRSPVEDEEDYLEYLWDRIEDGVLFELWYFSTDSELEFSSDEAYLRNEEDILPRIYSRILEER